MSTQSPRRKTTTSEAPAPPSLLDNPHLHRWGPALAIAILAFLFLMPLLHGVYIWDDNQWLTDSAPVQAWNGLGNIWFSLTATPQYYPLVFTTFWIEHKFWQLDPYGYHVDNLLLHIATALIIFHLLKKLKLPGGTLGAWLAAMIFAIHPVNVESVAWVAERKNVLCGVFFFSAILYALQFFHVIDAPDGPIDAKQLNGKQYVAAISLFLASMLAKTIACVFPPVILLMIWWRRGKIRRAEILLSLPFFAIAAALGFVTTETEHGSVGTTGPDWIYSPLGRYLAAHPDQLTTPLKLQALGQEFLRATLIAGQAVWFYAAKLVWPYPVVQVYPRFHFDIFQPSLYAAPVALLIVIILLFTLRKKITRGPLAAVLFFVGVLFPALGYINFYTMIYTFVADHYQYLACIAIIVLGVETLLWILRMVGSVVPSDLPTKDEGSLRFYRLTSGLLGGGIVLILGMWSNAVSTLYTNAEALWKFNTEMAPTAFAAWNNLGTTILQHRTTTPQEAAQNRAAAIDAYQHSITAEPHDWRAYHTLGIIYLNANQPEIAAEYLDKGESLMPSFVRNGRANFFLDQAKGGSQSHAATDHPLGDDTSDALLGPNFLLARNFEDHEQWDRAIACYFADLKENPANPETYYHLGNCTWLGKNDNAAAIAWYTKAIEKRPTYAEAYFNRGLCRRDMKQEQLGVADLLKARELDPTVVRHAPAVLREEAKRLQKIKEFKPGE